MSTFAIDNEVDNAADNRKGGTVFAVFPTADGNFRYSFDSEGFGAFEPSAEENLVPYPANLM
jgi:hypothetical protein